MKLKDAGPAGAEAAPALKPNCCLLASLCAEPPNANALLAAEPLVFVNECTAPKGGGGATVYAGLTSAVGCSKGDLTAPPKLNADDAFAPKAGGAVFVDVGLLLKAKGVGSAGLGALPKMLVGWKAEAFDVAFPPKG